MSIKIKYEATKDLNPYENNSRTHTAHQVSQIAKSIEQFGFLNPILIDDKKVLIAGHARLEAAKSLGMDKVPTIHVDYLSPAQRSAYVIADNKLALNSGWDYDLAKMEIEFLQGEGFDIDLLGFEPAELSSIMLERDEGDTDRYAEWEGMPEFDQPDATSHRHVIVHFENDDDVADFFAIVGQPDTGKTKSIWHPRKEQQKADSQYE